jgi:hypothetical protein
MLPSSGSLTATWRRPVLVASAAIVLAAGLGIVIHPASHRDDHRGQHRCDVCAHLDANPAVAVAVAPPPAPVPAALVTATPAAAPTRTLVPIPRTRAPPAPDSLS